MGKLGQRCLKRHQVSEELVCAPDTSKPPCHPRCHSQGWLGSAPAGQSSAGRPRAAQAGERGQLGPGARGWSPAVPALPVPGHLTGSCGAELSRAWGWGRAQERGLGKAGFGGELEEGRIPPLPGYGWATRPAPACTCCLHRCPRRVLGVKPPSLPARTWCSTYPSNRHPTAPGRATSGPGHQSRCPVRVWLRAAAVNAWREQKTAELYDSPIRHREREERGLIDALKIAGSVSDPESRIPVGRGREKGGRAEGVPTGQSEPGEMERGSRLEGRGGTCLPELGSARAGSRGGAWPAGSCSSPGSAGRETGKPMEIQVWGQDKLFLQVSAAQSFSSPLPGELGGARRRADAGRTRHVSGTSGEGRSGGGRGRTEELRPPTALLEGVTQVLWPSPAVQGWNPSDGGEHPSETPPRNPLPQVPALGLKKDGSRRGQTLCGGTRRCHLVPPNIDPQHVGSGAGMLGTTSTLPVPQFPHQLKRSVLVSWKRGLVRLERAFKVLESNRVHAGRRERKVWALRGFGRRTSPGARGPPGPGCEPTPAPRPHSSPAGCGVCPALGALGEVLGDLGDFGDRRTAVPGTTRWQQQFVSGSGGGGGAGRFLRGQTRSKDLTKPPPGRLSPSPQTLGLPQGPLGSVTGSELDSRGPGGASPLRNRSTEGRVPLKISVSPRPKRVYPPSASSFGDPLD